MSDDKVVSFPMAKPKADVMVEDPYYAAMRLTAKQWQVARELYAECYPVRPLLNHIDELVDALRAMLTVHDHGECEAMHPDTAENMARAALAKATRGA